jgi:hypothetical protein
VSYSHRNSDPLPCCYVKNRADDLMLRAIFTAHVRQVPELDKMIERYRRVAALIGDAVTVQRAKELLEEVLAEKAKLHPEK